MVGTLALAGVWPLSGFYSKDGILAQALAYDTSCALCARRRRGDADHLLHVPAGVRGFLDRHAVRQPVHAHESSARDGLAAAVPGGVQRYWRIHWIEASPTIICIFAKTQRPPGRSLRSCLRRLNIRSHCWPASSLSFSDFAPRPLSMQRAALDPLPAKLGALSRWMRNRFYFDEIYEATFIRFHEFLSAIADGIDRVVIAGLAVGLVRGGTELDGHALRQVQTGNFKPMPSCSRWAWPWCSISC